MIKDIVFFYLKASVSDITELNKYVVFELGSISVLHHWVKLSDAWDTEAFQFKNNIFNHTVLSISNRNQNSSKITSLLPMDVIESWFLHFKMIIKSTYMAAFQSVFSCGFVTSHVHTVQPLV